MPTLDSLEEIRKRNLAAEDAGISSVNAVNRMRGLPGVGKEGSTPATDRMNLGIASAMDRSDLGNRFGFGSLQYQQGTEMPTVAAPDQSGIDIAAVNQRRNQILQGIDPDAPARYVSDVPPKHGGLSRKAELQHELGLLTGIAQQHALETAQGAHENFITQKHIDTGNQVAGFFNNLGASKTQLGTPEHTQEILALGAKYPLALGAKEVRDVLKTHLANHVTASNFVAPEGTELTRVVQTSDGKSHAVFEPVSPTSTYTSKDELLKENPDAKPKQNSKGGWYDSGETSTAKISDSALKDLAKLNAEKAGKNLYLTKEVDPVKKGLLQKDIDALDASIGAWHETYGGKAKPVSSNAATTTTAPVVAVPSPDDIRAQYKAGKLTKDQATEMLKKGHGFE